MKKRVAIAGNILIDAVKMIDVWPEKGMLVNIVGESKDVGGCVCNTGIDLKVLDSKVDVVVYGKIGQDEYGQFVKSKMESKGIDVSNVVVVQDCSTSYSDVITVKSTGERTFFHYRGANATFTNEDVDVDNLHCDLFHLGYLLLLDSLDKDDLFYGTKAAKLLSDIQNKGIKTSIDLVSDQSGRFQKVVPPALKYCNYVIINEVEGGTLTNVSPRDKDGRLIVENLKQICSKIMGMGVKDAVVVHCPELSCSLERNNEFTIVPSLKLPKGYIVGAVGAGDAFCAGMLYSIVSETTIKEGMELASCVAACNLAAATSTDGAKTLDETLKLEEVFSRGENYVC